jgi:hypothetical protein
MKRYCKVFKLGEADHRRVDREESGCASVTSRTSKPIQPTDLNSKESVLSGKSYELELTRIHFIRTKNKRREAEEDLNKQDQ